MSAPLGLAIVQRRFENWVPFDVSISHRSVQNEALGSLRQTTSRRGLPLGISHFARRKLPYRSLCRLVLRRWSFHLVFQPGFPRPPGVFKTTLRAFHMGENVGQVGEGLDINLDASRDRAVCVWALN
jgi:hypothetical protein